jgi:hypothetical protein
MEEIWIFLIIIFLVIVFICLAAFVFFDKKTNVPAPTPSPPEELDSFELTVDIDPSMLEYQFLVVRRNTFLSLDVDWGDGVIENFKNVNSPLILVHTYDTPEIYTIKCTNSNVESLINYIDPDIPPLSITNKVTNAMVKNLKKMLEISILDSLLTNLNIEGSTILRKIELQGNTLTQEGIDNILTTFNNFNTTYGIGTDGGTIDLSNQNPPTSPGPSGIAAKNELESRNWTVITDP